MASFGFDRRDIEEYQYWPNGFTTYENGKAIHHDPVIINAEQKAALEAENPKLQIYRVRHNQTLQEVDELICDFMGEPKPDPNRDSDFYYVCHEYGWWALYALGGDVVEQRHIDHIWEKVKPILEKEGYTEGKLARVKHLLQWVFLDKWIFWGTG